MIRNTYMSSNYSDLSELKFSIRVDPIVIKEREIQERLAKK